MTDQDLLFLKLGGSLITDKLTARTLRQDVLTRLAGEITAALMKSPDLRLLVGHGSGSFGHFAAKQYGTYDGVRRPDEWLGFARVWKDARELNQLVLDALALAGLPVMAFPASAIVTTARRSVLRWETETIQKALAHNLIPVIQGDVVFDSILGGTILSTEDQFFHLAARLKPRRILLAGIEPGVWEDFPACTRLLDHIRLDDYANIADSLGASAGVDVTGGMVHKVTRMLDVIRENPGLDIRIFSGEKPGNLEQALLGAELGTLLSA
jgi:isopentenyl phosphate kinase